VSHFRYLSVDEVLALHEIAIQNGGGGPLEVRDPGGVEAAVFQPQAGFGDILFYKTVPEIAAAYAYFIAQRQAFVEGNKRTGWLAACTFVEMNGGLVEATDDDAIQMLLEVSKGLSLESVADWFAERIVQLVHENLPKRNSRPKRTSRRSKRASRPKR